MKSINPRGANLDGNHGSDCDTFYKLLVYTSLGPSVATWLLPRDHKNRIYMVPDPLARLKRLERERYATQGRRTRSDRINSDCNGSPYITEI